MMVSDKIKACIAFAVVAVLVAGAGTLVGLSMHLRETAGTFNPAGEAERTIGEDGMPKVDWDFWLGVNPDIVGWITVPGTNIDHPVVQAQPADPQYYLDHDVYGNWNPYGAIYLDSECIETGMASQNTMIYGHNMGWDQSMFADFERYVDESFARGHATIMVQTPKGETKAEVRFANNQDGGQRNKRVSFTGEEDFMCWYAERFAEADVRLIRDVSAAYKPVTYTFCCCSYFNSDDERVLVYAA